MHSRWRSPNCAKPARCGACNHMHELSKCALLPPLPAMCRQPLLGGWRGHAGHVPHAQASRGLPEPCFPAVSETSRCESCCAIPPPAIPPPAVPLPRCSVYVDPESRTAVVDGGALACDVDTETALHGWVPQYSGDAPAQKGLPGHGTAAGTTELPGHCCRSCRCCQAAAQTSAAQLPHQTCASMPACVAHPSSPAPSLRPT